MISNNNKYKKLFDKIDSLYDERNKLQSENHIYIKNKNNEIIFDLGLITKYKFCAYFKDNILELNDIPAVVEALEKIYFEEEQ